MITLRPAGSRGATRLAWLESRHSFSFGAYHDPAQMGFRSLRVINEDTIAPKGGFPTHSHRDMEIVTYVTAGRLSHRDSLGSEAGIAASEVQVMSAGTGISHSEFNASGSAPVHLLQIWILPDREGHAPRYDQRAFPREEKRGRLKLLVSGDGRDGSLMIHQDANLYAAILPAGARLRHDLKPGRSVWVQLASGRLALNGIALGPGDGVAVSEESRLDLAAGDESELLLFDLGSLRYADPSA